MEPLEFAVKVCVPAATGAGTVYRLFLHRRVSAAFASRRAREANIAQIPEMVASLGQLKTTLDEVRHELRFNGGNSLRDEVRSIGTRGAANEQRLRALLQTSTSGALFETNAAGEWIWVNRSLTVLTQRSVDELTGLGWKNAVDPVDRPAVAEEWKFAVRDRRECSVRFRVERRRHDRSDGARPAHRVSPSDVWVTLTSFPFRSDVAGVLGYFGILELDATVPID